MYRFYNQDIFNANKFGDCYGMAPEVAIAQERMFGRKKVKVRMSVLVFANENGSKEVSLTNFVFLRVPCF